MPGNPSKESSVGSSQKKPGSGISSGGGSWYGGIRSDSEVVDDPRDRSPVLSNGSGKFVGGDRERKAALAFAISFISEMEEAEVDDGDARVRRADLTHFKRFFAGRRMDACWPRKSDLQTLWARSAYSASLVTAGIVLLLCFCCQSCWHWLCKRTRARLQASRHSARALFP